MSQPRDELDLFRPPLMNIINLRHSLVQLAGLGQKSASERSASPVARRPTALERRL